MDGLKQRIIGALVLISLAVIFVPMMFDEPHTERSSQAIDLPEEEPFPQVGGPDEPAMEDGSAESPAYRIEEPDDDLRSGDTSAEVFEGEAPAPQPVSDRESGDTREPASQPVAVPEEPASSVPDMPESDQAPEREATEQAEREELDRTPEGAWVVQLGSFGQAGNARRLRDRVREAGYDAHTQEIQRGGATLTRVFSGPFADKSDAEDAKTSLDQAFDVNGLVTTGGGTD